QMSPSTGLRKPATPFRSVDLPQPEGPRRTKRSARKTSKLTRYVAVTRCSRVLYWSLTGSTSSKGAGLRAGSGALVAHGATARSVIGGSSLNGRSPGPRRTAPRTRGGRKAGAHAAYSRAFPPTAPAGPAQGRVHRTPTRAAAGIVASGLPAASAAKASARAVLAGCAREHGGRCRPASRIPLHVARTR